MSASHSRSTAFAFACIIAFALLPSCADSAPTAPARQGAEGEADGKRADPKDELTAIPLGSLGGGETSALGINDRGEVVGVSTDSEGRWRAFVWNAGDGMRELAMMDDHETATALDINNAGVIVGSGTPSTFPGFPGTVPVRWLANGAIERLPTREEQDGGGGVAVAINNRGDIVGHVGGDFFGLWSSDGRALEVSCGRGFPADISDNGTIIGISSVAVGSFVLHDEGIWEYSGFVMTPGDDACRGMIDKRALMMEATGINSRGDAVGWGGEYFAPPEPGSPLVLSTEEPLVYSGRRGVLTRRPGLPERPVAINDRGDVIGEDFTAINNRGDRVGGGFLWTTRPDAFDRQGAQAAPVVADVRGGVSSLPALALEVEVELERCPPSLAHLVRARAFPACPVPLR